MGKRKTYTGDAIEIDFDMSRCIHARACFLKLPQVFDPSKRPWVDPNAASGEEIAAMVRTCPSGALGFRRLDAGDQETPPQINRIEVRENGPNALVGDLTIDGEPAIRATLCRCGQSKNMPYCDYSHVEAGFSASGEPKPDVEDRPADAPAGAVSVRSIANGPLGVQGPVEVTTGTGVRVMRGERVFLCRCGASKTKPFCDGSHSAIDFVAPGPAQ